MSDDEAKLKSPDGNSETASDYDMRCWILGLVGSACCFMLFTWALVQVFDQIKELSFGSLVICLFLIVPIAAKPTTYRDAAIVSVIGGAVGTLMLPSLLAVESIAESLASPFWRDVFAWLGAVLCAILLALAGVAVYLRLAHGNWVTKSR